MSPTSCCRHSHVSQQAPSRPATPLVASRLALGTAQFGSPYGIANRRGVPTPAEIDAMLAEARTAGLDTLDTAVEYGTAEERLGSADLRGWRVVSKLPPVPQDSRHPAQWIGEVTRQCLARLRIDSLDTVLLHQPDQLHQPWGEDIYRALVRLREEGLARRIGVSVYGPVDIEALWPSRSFDLIQAPLSIADRRLVSSGMLDRLAAAGVSVHVRSVFLQGLLVMEPAERPRRFDRWSGFWQAWDAWLASEEVDPLDASLQFALGHGAVERVVVGVDEPSQLRRILEGVNRSVPSPPADLRVEDPDFIDPRRWNIART
jgi:aryl-alcohol dehydrogenase-like predicted oxidoreductase